MRSFATVLAFAASTLAYSITAPTNATGFFNNGQNTVSWNKVSTDPTNFTIVLVNNNMFPNYAQVLDALVQGDLGTVKVNAPSTGWPQSGAGYQINFVQDSEHLSSILAQSDDFSFHAPVVSSSSSGISTGSAPTTALTVPTSSNPSSSTPTGASTGSGSSDLNPSTSDTATNPQNTNAAAPAMGVQAAFFGAVALVGAILA